MLQCRFWFSAVWGGTCDSALLTGSQVMPMPPAPPPPPPRPPPTPHPPATSNFSSEAPGHWFTGRQEAPFMAPWKGVLESGGAVPSWNGMFPQRRGCLTALSFYQGTCCSKRHVAVQLFFSLKTIHRSSHHLVSLFPCRSLITSFGIRMLSYFLFPCPLLCC